MGNTSESQASADVLVIDDDPIMRDLVADWLEAAGYGVRKAADCCAGVAEAERAAPALVVTDMCMAGPSGAVAIAKIRQRHEGMPVIALSGHFHFGHGLSAETALQAGAARALPKPVTRVEFMRAVADLLGPPPR